MRNLQKSLTTGILLLVVSLSTLANPALAQTSQDEFGVAYPVEIKVQEGQTIENGMIVAHKNGQYTLSAEAYDRAIIGSVNLFPKIEYIAEIPNSAAEENTTPIISSGISPVLVSGETGAIQEGDLITASSVPGIGMKATKSGFTLGIATESFAGSTIDERGIINVRILKDFTFGTDTPDSETISQRLRDVVSLSAIAAIDDPQQVFQYVVAAFILISAIIIAFVSFSRTSQKGIEALGRNPLAQTSIITGIFVNIVVSIIIISAGIAGAYFVVTF